MEIVDYTLDDHVAIVTMNSKDNRFNLTFMKAFMDVLDKIENETKAGAIVVRSAHEKIWSNGIDLDWLFPAIENEGPEAAKRFFIKLMRFLRRILTYPMITVAVINGHAFAGGALLACAFDFRFMRSDRGFFCLPEIDLKIPFLPGMDAIIKKAMPTKSFEMEFTGARLTAQECEKHGLVRKACHLDGLMDEALTFAKSMNKDRETLSIMKNITFTDIIRIMDETDPGHIEKMSANFLSYK